MYEIFFYTCFSLNDMMYKMLDALYMLWIDIWLMLTCMTYVLFGWPFMCDGSYMNYLYTCIWDCIFVYKVLPWMSDPKWVIACPLIGDVRIPKMVSCLELQL